MIRRAFGDSGRSVDAVNRAAHWMVEQLEQRLMLAVTPRVPLWLAQGPSPLVGSGTNVVIPGANPAAGAVQAVATPVNNSSIVFAGSVNGGVWRTVNAQAAEPTWTPLTDQMRSLSIGALAISPFDADGNAITPASTTPVDKLVIFAGLADNSSGAQLGGPRRGLLWSTQGGKVGTWRQLGVREFYGLDVRAIVPSQADHNVLFVAVRTRGGASASKRAGVWKITTDGKSFEQVFKGEVSDLIGVPGNANTFLAGVPGKGIFRSTTGGGAGSWNSVNTGLDVLINNGIDDDRNGKSVNPQNDESVAGSTRINLASSANSIFAAMSGKTNRIMGVYQFDAANTQWLLISNLPDLNPGQQSYVHVSLAADPNNPKVVFVGGDRVPTAVPVPYGGPDVYTANIWRADLNKAAGSQWEQVTMQGAGGASLPTAPHPDSRTMVFDKSGNLIEGDDGGVYRLVSPNTPASRSWDSRDGNLKIGEFYSVELDSLGNAMFGGMQDNGVVDQQPGFVVWNNVPTGDGALVAVDNSQAGVTTRYGSGANLHSFQKRTFGPDGTQIGSSVDLPLLVQGTGVGAARVSLTAEGSSNSGILLTSAAGQPKKYAFDPFRPFVTQFAVNKVNPNKIMIGSQVLYESTDGGMTVKALAGLDTSKTNDGVDDDNDGNSALDPNEVQPFGFKGKGEVTALAYGAVGNENAAFVAEGKYLFVREALTAGDDTDFAERTAYRTDAKGGSIRDIALDDGQDWHNGYLVDNRGNVYAFTDTGKTAGDWTRITGNLGRYTNDVRTVEVIRSGDKFFVLVGGLGGVFATDNPQGKNTRWFQVGRGLPHVIVRDLHYVNSHGKDALICGTWGRGAWRIDNFLATIAPAAAVAVPLSQSIQTVSPQSYPAGFVGPLPYSTAWNPTIFVGPLPLSQLSAPQDITPLALGAGDPGVLEITGDELANKDDVFRLVLDPGNSDILDVFVNNTTDSPDFMIEAASVQKVIVTGGQGNDTLTIDDANGLVKFPEGIDFATPDAGDVQQEINQTPISGGIVSKIRSGLEGLADFGSKLADFAELAEQIPGLGISLAQTLAIGDGSDPIGGVLKKGLVDPISNFLQSDGSSTVQGLVDFIKGLSDQLGNVSFGINAGDVSGGMFPNASGNQDLRIDLSLHLAGFAGQIPLDFGASLGALGLSFSSSGKIDLDTGLDLSLSFGVDLTPGLSDSDAFFVELNDMSASAHASAGQTPAAALPGTSDSGESDGGDADGQAAQIVQMAGGEDSSEGEEEEEGALNQDTPTGAPINLDLKLGFLDAKVVNGSFKLDASLGIELTNPDSDPDGHVTLSELTSTSLSSLLNVNVQGDLELNLPVEVSLAGLHSDAQPLIRITSDDLFDSVPEVTTENFDDLLNFNNISAASVLSLIRQLADSLGQLGHSDVLQVPIPLTGKTLGQVLDFASMATKKLTDPLVDTADPNQPAFGSAQDLAVRLASALGLDPSIINAHYDAATQELTYHVSFADTFSTDADIDLGLDLGALGGISTSSKFTVDASAGAEFTFGISLAPPTAGETLADRFFIQDATLTGSANLSASAIAAEAKLGFLGVGVHDGAGDLSASARIDLQNPVAQTTAPLKLAPLSPSAPVEDSSRRIKLSDFLPAILSNPSSLIAPASATSLTPGANVNVSNKAGNQIEPVVVIDPTNPMRMFIASNNERAGSLTGAFSTDGGATWTARDMANGAAGDGFEFACCDPSATFDRFGNLYLAYLNNTHDKVTVLLSTDGGQSFTLLKTISAAHLDRPVLASGPGDAADNAGVWLGYLDLDNGISITAARVTGIGAANIGAFSTPAVIPNTTLDNFADLAVGPKGQVLATWQFADTSAAEGPSNIYVSLDPDGLGAQSFGTAKLVTSTNVGPSDTIPAQPDRKITADPHIAYAMSGPHIGRAYLVYTDEKLATNGDETDDTNILLRFTDHDDLGWSKPTAVSHDADGRSQFFGHLAVDPKSGNVAVGWYDARNDPINQQVEFFVGLSTDGGASFPSEVKVSTGASDERNAPPDAGATDVDFGDYSGLAFFGGTMHPAWADNSAAHGKFDIYTASVAVSASAGGSAQPLAPVQPDAGTGGLNFTGSASLDLPISVTPAGLLNVPDDAAVQIDWSDLSDPSTLDVQFIHLDDALNFKGLNFDAILAALQGVVDYLGKLQGFGFLNDKIPLVNVSVSDLLDFAHDFGDKLNALRANPAGTLQQAADAIDNAFGLSPGTITFSIDGPNHDILKTDLNLASSLTTTKSLNFDLGSLLAHATGSDLANLAGIVNIAGSANLDINLDTALNLDLGIDLSDPTSPRPFIYDTDTAFSIDANIDANIPNLSVSIGPLSAAIVNGTASLHPTGTDKLFSVALNDGDADGRHYLDASGLSSILSDAEVAVHGAIDVDLPIQFPVGHALTPDLVISIPDLGALFHGDAGSVQIVSAPDLASSLNLDLLNNLSGLLDGFDQLLGLLQGALDSKAFDRNLPLVGDHLKDGAQVIADFRSHVIAELKPLFDAPASKTVDYVKNALFDVLGPSDLNVLGNGDANPAITADDIGVVMDDPTTPNDVRFDFHLHKDPSATSFKPAFDIGIPALQLQAAGQVDVAMGFDFAVGIGINRSVGPYFDTSATNELKLDFSATVPTLQATGRLAFLQMDVADDPAHPSALSGMFNVDLSAPDNRLTIGNLTSASLDARLQADADINLGLTVGAGNENFPSLMSDLHVGWHFDSDTSDATFGDAPQVAFNNIRLKLGDFLSHFAGPVLGEIKKVLDPLQPIVDLLHVELTPLEKISSVRNFFDVDGDKHVLVEEVIEKLDPNPVLDFIDAIGAFNQLISAIPSNPSDFELNLGSFDLNNLGDLRQMSDLSNAQLTDVNERHDVLSQLDGQAHGFAQALQDPKLGSASGAGGGSFEMPLLQHPAQAFKLFLGQDVDLFRWQMPALHLNLSINQEFPLLGPINVSFGGSLEVNVQAGFGFDTSGLREWRNGGQPSDVFDGFFLIDKPQGSTVDPPEIEATGKITVGAGIDVIIASASVSGSLVGTLDLNLDDPNNDGKVRFKELKANLDLGPICIFDITGTLGLQISAHASIGVWPLEDSFNYDSPVIELLSFSHDCKTDAAQPDPILATDLGAGVLRLNMGSNAAERQTVNTTDGDESFTVGPDPNNPGQVLVSAFGFSQSFAGITTIVAEAGEGDDSVLIDPTLDVTAVLVGGPGNDALQAGAGRASLLGQEGNDTLTGGGADDKIGGDAGDDLIDAGAGNDTVSAGDGNDNLTGGDGDDQLNGQGGNDLIDAGTGNDTASGGDGDDTIQGGEGNDSLGGDAGNDRFHGGEGDDSESGGDGADSLAGDQGNDTLDGGNDADVIHGADGTDSLIGGAGNDSVFGEAGNDTLAGNDADDSLLGGDGDDSIDAGAGNDSVLGEAGNDSALGGDGSDSIDGGAGNDTLDGQLGDDRITGSTGDDSILGSDGNDILLGADGADSAIGGAGNDSIDGQAGNDSLQGSAGNDTIHGQEGDDSIAGQDDADRLFGDAGNDIITGGAGADYIEGGADQDNLSGDDDPDTIFGNTGDDSVHGGAGDDSLRGGSDSDTAFGDAGNDSVFGDAGADAIFGDEGQATVVGGIITRLETIDPDSGGNDLLDAGDGADTALGGAGNDSIIGGSTDDAPDVLLGDNGAVVLSDGSPDANHIFSTDPTAGGNDTLTSGGGDDIVIGGTASDNIDAGAGNDLLFGDHGRIDLSAPLPVSFVSIDTGASDGGADDRIDAGAGDDTAIGEQGSDRIVGQDGDDDLIGGHNVSGGADGNDSLDGGAGSDVIAGDNARIVRRGDLVSFIVRALAGPTLYNTSGQANVTAGAENNPLGTPARDITLLDHSDSTPNGPYGDDQIAGGAGSDSLFGELGNDIMQGDSSIAIAPGASTPSVSGPADGDDYLEGGGGNDAMFGNLGQDDLIGGSSNLFGLATPSQRPDGADLIFGGSGTDLARNTPGDTTAGGHARDADAIVGDNGNIYRIVSAPSSGFATFNYDDYAGSLRIIPRAVDLLDYSPDDVATNDAGAGDVIHGEAGDDSIHGAAGDDTLFGEGQDDDLYGETGSDWISGGSGDDGILGDDGRISTSRNGKPEPLYGITASVQTVQQLNAIDFSTVLNPTGALSKSVDLEPFDQGGDDLIYGGLGADSIHGGAGQDAISGAEAMSAFYSAPAPAGLVFDAAGEKFASFDLNDPFAKIAGHPLNFDAFDNSGTPIDDGDDKLFGDLGNDWIVGGTGRDNLYGGFGDDILNADDNLDNPGVDPAPLDGPDFAFGGGGRDILIANATTDRLIDWNGNFNPYFVPFNPFGQQTIIRQVSKGLPELLYAISRSDGADQTRIGPGLGSADRNGEPAGELGLVLQQDAAWNDQQGPPLT